MSKKSKDAKRKAKRQAAIKKARREEHEQNVEFKKFLVEQGFVQTTRPWAVVMFDLDNRLIDRNDRLRVLPSSAYDDIPHPDLRMWCNVRAVYGVPTTELVEWLREFIGDRTAIEVGSGNGALGRALGIPRTDSRVQEDPEVARLYRAQGQATVHYGPDVERLEAVDAVRKYDPQVVVGCWVTNWVDPHKPFRAGAGSMYGIREEQILDHPSVEHYVVVGHLDIHAQKPIMALPHETHRFPWLRSRSKTPGREAIFVWEGSKRREGAS